MICLLPHCSYLSETSRMLQIADALRARAISFRIACHGGTFVYLLGTPGTDYDIVTPEVSADWAARFVQLGPGIGPPDQSMWTDDEMVAHVLGEADYFREHDIDVVVTGFALTALLSTRLVGAALVTDHAGSYVPPVAERGLLPLPIGELPPPLATLPADIAREAWNSRYSNHLAYCAGFNRVADKLGVPGIPSMAALLLGDLTLITEAPEVLGIPASEMAEWSPAGKPNYRPETRLRYCGPIHAHLDIPLPQTVLEFLARHNEPVAYLAMTSCTERAVRAVVEQLQIAEIPTIVAGTVHDLSDMTNERMLVEKVLPSHLIMPLVQVAVITGGQGSVQAALSAGTPFVGIPLQPEQDLNVALVADKGAAIRLSPTQASGPELITALRNILQDSSYRDSAESIRQVYAALDGPGAAADVIARLQDRMVGEPATVREKALH